MRKSLQYRLFPTKRQVTLLGQTLDECRWLYNHFLAERNQAWEDRKELTSRIDQQNTLPALKEQRPTLKLVYGQVLQNIATRLDRGFRDFFRRIKAGEKPGYPRFRGRGRYDSFTYPQAGAHGTNLGIRVIDGRVVLPKIGHVKIKLHRPLQGNLKTCTIKRSSTGKWYATFSCEEVPVENVPESKESVGIDVGLKTFATFSTGETVANPRFFRRDEKALAQAQRRMEKFDKGTPERTKRRKAVARVHERIRFRRHNFAHQQSRLLVNRFDVIVAEHLVPSSMVRNRTLAKSIQDVSWGLFRIVLANKATCAGRQFIAVPPAYTSQTCSVCGHRQPMPLDERIYRCTSCSVNLDRDHNAALNILALGQQRLAQAKKPVA